MSGRSRQAEERVVRLSRVFNTTAEHLYACFTDPALVAQWWGPEGAVCPGAENDLRLGGRFRFQMRGVESGELNVVVGEYLEIEPGLRLAFTWQWEGSDEKSARSFCWSTIVSQASSARRCTSRDGRAASTAWSA